MKCAIFYFSGTGNTKWVVKKTTKLLKQTGVDASNYSLEKLANNHAEIIASCVQNCEYIGFACPIYGADVPRIMKEFFEEFISLSKAYDNSKTKLFFINTFGYVNGHGYFKQKEIFKNCHLPIMGYVNFRLTNNTKVRDREKPLFGNLIPDSIKRKSYGRIRNLINAMENDKCIINGIGPHLIIGQIIRNNLKNKIQNNYINMAVDYEKCTKCMHCVKNCPVESIKFENDRFIFTDSCEACFRCYNICPSNAIIMNNKYRTLV